MANIMFEDMSVNIQEEVETVRTDYDIENDVLIAKKVLDKTITSKIYTYEDGISAYLKFDDSGINQFIDIMFALYRAKSEKKIVCIAQTADAVLKRIDKSHFHLLIKDKVNHEGSLVFITIKDEKEVITSQVYFTELVDYQIIDMTYVIVNCYEVINNKKVLHTLNVYNLAGMLIKSLVDKSSSKILHYEFQMQHKPDNERVLLALEYKSDKIAVVGKLPMPEGLSADGKMMYEENKKKIKVSEVAQKEEVVQEQSEIEPPQEATKNNEPALEEKEEENQTEVQASEEPKAEAEQASEQSNEGQPSEEKESKPLTWKERMTLRAEQKAILKQEKLEKKKKEKEEKENTVEPETQETKNQSEEPKE